MIIRVRLHPLLLWMLVFSGCRQQGDSTVSRSQNAEATCALPPGKYEVQNATFQNSEQRYKFFVLSAPPCVRQPVSFDKVKLARIDNAEGKPTASLEVASAEDPTLFLTENFKIDLIQSVTDSSGQVRQESSTWMPFLAGAAGAAVAGMAMNALFNKPQYYMPPPPQPGSAVVKGYGSSGSTYQGAVNSYQKNWQRSPQSPTPVGGKSFFRKKSDFASAPPGQRSSPSLERRTFPNRLQSPQKRSFFRRQRR